MTLTPAFVKVSTVWLLSNGIKDAQSSKNLCKSRSWYKNNLSNNIQSRSYWLDLIDWTAIVILTVLCNLKPKGLDFKAGTSLLLFLTLGRRSWCFLFFQCLQQHWVVPYHWYFAGHLIAFLCRCNGGSHYRSCARAQTASLKLFLACRINCLKACRTA